MGFPWAAALSKFTICLYYDYVVYSPGAFYYKFIKNNYIQPRLDYGITLYGCSTQKNIDLVQRIKNHAACSTFTIGFVVEYTACDSQMLYYLW